MKRFGLTVMRQWASLGPRFFPFADVATPDLSLGRLLRLSLFQVSVGMALVLLVGTLNRVMIVELGVPASVVGLMIALPIVFAPFRALIGFRSDTHRSALGWRRVPFIWRGSLIQFGGFAIMPFALLVLAGQGEASTAPQWIGVTAAALSFLMVGAGLHTVQTAGLALATDLTPESSHPRVVGLMYVTLLLGMIASSLLFGAALVDFSPGRLVQVVQGAAVATLILNVVAVWKQEARNPLRGAPDPSPDPSFREAWSHFAEGEHAVHHLTIVGIGTMAFGMADVLLEPFGGQVLGMSVSSTTLLTALFAGGGLIGFMLASFLLGQGGDPIRWTRNATILGIPAFLAVLIAGPIDLLPLFLVGNVLIGVGAAIFSHSTLTATMNRAPKDQIGLALGSWGAVQATAAGLAIALSGAVRDVVQYTVGSRVSVGGMDPVATGYVVVFSLEVVLLVVTLAAVLPLMRARQARATDASPATAPLT
jgi:BCD family chlorophyll transporter-like MFS transporter